MQALSRSAAFIWAAGVLSVAGCGGGSGTVNGTVKYDGTPLDTGTIEFRTPNGAGVVASASVSSGAFKVPETAHIPPGTYKVQIRSSRTTGKKIPAGSPSPPGTMVEETVEMIPEKYNKRSSLEKEVKPGPNTFEFDLKK